MMMMRPDNDDDVFFCYKHVIFCCNRQPWKLHPINIFATMATLMDLFCCNRCFHLLRLTRENATTGHLCILLKSIIGEAELHPWHSGEWQGRGSEWSERAESRSAGRP